MTHPRVRQKVLSRLSGGDVTGNGRIYADFSPEWPSWAAFGRKSVIISPVLRRLHLRSGVAGSPVVPFYTFA